MGQHIFISYASQDARLANILRKRLRAKRFNTWMYEYDQEVGAHYPNVLEEKIASSSHVIFLLSPDFRVSKFVDMEILLAQKHEKNVLPLLVRPCEPHPLLLPYHIEDISSSDGKNLASLSRIYSHLRQDREVADERRDESNRRRLLSLLEKQRTLLKQLALTPNLLGAGSSSKSSTMDLRKAEEWRETLWNEADKVKRSEAVIVVVGNTNSGKTTLIDSIIGREILPRDLDPMTSIPTLVRHVSGKKRPTLNIPEPDPITEFVERLHYRLKQLEQSGRLSTLDLYNQTKGRSAITWLLSFKPGTNPILRKYEGLTEIHRFLGNLNSWMRLCHDKSVNVDQPTMAFSRLEQIPYIEVEFPYLQDGAGATKSFVSILDTPGLGEYGATQRLRKILHTQLSRASAILAVVDATRIKDTEAERIRKDISQIALGIGERLYIIINKIDDVGDQRRDWSGVSEHMSRNIVPASLNLEPERVIPISAFDAFISTRALAVLEQTGRLPDPNDEPWVQPFAEKVFGLRWAEEVQRADVGEVRDLARALLDSSRFKVLMEIAISPTAKEASLISMGSALAKMKEYDRVVANFLKRRRSALSSDEEHTRQQIAQLEMKIKKIGAARESFMEEILAVTQDVQNHAESLFENKKKRLSYFLKGNIKNIRKTIYKSYREVDQFWEDKVEFVFRYYQEVTQDLEKEISNYTAKRFASFRSRVSKMHKLFASEAQSYLEDQKLIILKIDMPQLQLNVEQIKYLDIVPDEYEEPQTKYVAKEGFWAELARDLGDLIGENTWGRREVTKTIKKIEVDPEDVINEIMDDMEGRMARLEKSIMDFSDKELSKYVEKMLSPLQSALRNLEGDLKDGLERKSNNKLENEKGIKNIDKLCDLFVGHATEADQLFVVTSQVR